MAMLQELEDSDWGAVFSPEYATPTKVAGAPEALSVAAVAREDVKRVIAMDDGENDGPSWVGVFELRDGRFFAIEAGCDYTGWDCQAGGSSQVASTEEAIIRFGLSQGDRQRLGLRLPEEVDAAGQPTGGAA